MSIQYVIENFFVCPICGCSMYVTDDCKSAKCKGNECGKKQHSFDFSADGYLSFGQTGGDSKEAVRARRLFLRKDYYLPAAYEVCSAVKKYIPSCNLLIDAGCGEGYYTSMLSDVSDIAIGFDLSKFACGAGAKQAKNDRKNNLFFATSSVFSLPLSNECADAVTNIFAPCAEDEYSRILKDGGCLFVVGAGKEHLMGLKQAIYDNVYENGERADLPVKMKHIDRIITSHTICVEGESDIGALFSMTPYYWRTKENDREKLKGLDRLTTEISFEINIYKK